MKGNKEEKKLKKHIQGFYRDKSVQVVQWMHFLQYKK